MAWPLSASRWTAVALAAAAVWVAAACTGTPAAAPSAGSAGYPGPEVGTAVEPGPQAQAATLWCQWKGRDPAVTIDGKPLNFLCETGDPARPAGLFGGIEDTGYGWMMALAPVSRTESGATVGAVTMVTVDYIVLQDGTQCANAGHGATTGYDDKRLNYTCQVPTGQQVGLFGDVDESSSGWQITEAEFAVTAGGPTVTAPTAVMIKALGVPRPAAVP
jgi:hypothetical protein